MSPILTGVIASGISGNLIGPSSFESISTVTLSANTSTLTISSIPSNFQHLQLRCDVRGTTGAISGNYPDLRVNGDTGSNYTYSYVETYAPNSPDAIVTGSTGNLGQLYGPYFLNNDNHAAGYFASLFINIADYSSTNKYKTWQATGGWTDRSVARISSMAGHWMSNSAINSITLTPASGSWVTGSTFALYGIKNT
jgi:hypothetical protein